MLVALPELCRYPVAILTSEVEFAGAGDQNIRPQVGGEVRFSQVVIHADGDNSNVSEGVINQLQDYDVTLVKTTQLSGYDNNNG